MVAPSECEELGVGVAALPVAGSWASSVGVRRAMMANRRVDTKPELLLRSAAHRSGLRFRKDFRIRVPGVSVHADFAFPAVSVAVFVDGCFWHRCPEHGTVPQRNAEFWASKLERNVERDQLVDLTLTRAGWMVIRCWEHEQPSDVVPRIASALERRR
jgi:DNA mismatch endonuclease (patch repair protein)